MIRVLFVDDDPEILRGLERMLFARTTWECAFASSAMDALRILEQGGFDVVVSDMRMPGMDGAALLEGVLKRHPRVIRFVLTGQTEFEAATRIASVAHQFLSKPCSPDVLQEAIERACSLRDRLADERLRAAAGRIRSLPARPRVYGELTRVLRDPRASVGSVARIIEQHPGLSAKVLQLVNSAFIGLQHRTTSVEQAVQYIGFQLLRGLVMGCEVFSLFVDDDRTAAVSEVAHALLSARLASHLAPDRALAEEAFTAGLLHHVGRLVLEREFPAKMRRAKSTAFRTGRPLHEVELEQFGIAQGEIGGYLLALWGIPLPIVEAVFYYSEPWRFASTRFELPAMLHVACRLAHEVQDAAAALSTEHAALSDAYLARLGVVDQLPAWRWAAREFAKDADAEVVG